MLKNVTAPADNERGPRYMEKALAALHHSTRHRDAIAFEYGSYGGQIGLFVRCADRLEELVCGPVTANYPQCLLTSIKGEDWKHELETWSMELRLVPDLFPILRHGQFEDQLNRNFADPISGILRAVRPDEGLSARIEIVVSPVKPVRQRVAIERLRHLTRPFFTEHPHAAAFYARWAGHGWRGVLATFIGMLAARSGHGLSQASLNTSTSRTHEREADLQAASDKLGGHLFDTRIRLSVTASKECRVQAVERLQSMVGAFGAFTKSRLAMFEASP